MRSLHFSLLRNLNWIVDVVMWPNFGYSSIFMREVIITQILYGFDQKTRFFEGCSWFKFNNLRLVLCKAVKVYSSMGRRLKLKLRKCWGKLVGGLLHFLLLPSWIGLKMNWLILVLWKPLKRRRIGFIASLSAMCK